jgi:hypothetical protein
LHHTRVRFAELFLAAALTVCAGRAQVTASIGGQIYNSANDDFINGATVILTQADGAAQPLKFVTETRGLFLFENLPPGRYLLFAECPGFARAAFGSRGNLSGVTLSLVETQQMNDLAFPLTPGSSIEGKVMDASGTAIEGATVLALQPIYERGKKEYVPAASAISDGLGDYKLSDLAAGSYLVAASDNTGESATTWFPAATASDGAETVTLAAASAVTMKDIRMAKASGHRVTGTLEGGKAALAWLTPKGGATSMILRRPAKIQADGNFAFANVPPGAYILSATESDGVTAAAAPTALTVGQKDLDAVTLHGQSELDLEGEIALGTNTTPFPPGIEVVLETADAPLPRPERAPVDQKGRFTFYRLAPGRYVLHVLAPPALYVRSARYHGADVADEPFDFAGGAGSLLIYLSSGGAGLGGTVRGADGSPMPGATVALAPTLRRYSHYKEVTTDQFGEFHFEGIAPGEYRVFAFDHIEPGQYQDAAWLKKYEFKGQPFTAKAGGRETIPLKAIQ